MRRTQTQMQNNIKNYEKNISDLQQMNQALDQKIAKMESQNQVLTDKVNDKTKIIKLRQSKERIKILQNETEEKNQLLKAASEELQTQR